MEQVLKALYRSEFVSEFSSSLQIQVPLLNCMKAVFSFCLLWWEFYSREVRKQRKEKMVLPGEI